MRAHKQSRKYSKISYFMVYKHKTLILKSGFKNTVERLSNYITEGYKTLKILIDNIWKRNLELLKSIDRQAQN